MMNYTITKPAPWDGSISMSSWLKQRNWSRRNLKKNTISTSNRHIVIPSDWPRIFCKQLGIILKINYIKEFLRMGNGESRPAVFTESNCHSGKDLIDALTCDICKDIFWEWCHNLYLLTSIAAINSHVWK